MPKQENQKLKLLFLLRILHEQTDEAHPITVQQLIDALAANDVSAERKTIYADIQALQWFGFDIVVLRGRQNQYYWGERQFQLPELKLLVDAAQSAKFITEKKSNELIGKISNLASRHEAGLLRRQVYVQGRVKAMNESIYYTVDLLQSALSQGKQISFQYYEWAIDRTCPRNIARRWRRQGQPYQTSPWALVWDDENYYLVGYDDTDGIFKHYRVDKMANLSLLDKARNGAAAFENMDMAQYTKRTFGMYGGVQQDVKLRFANHLIGVVVDRFGKNVLATLDGDDHFVVMVQAVVSPQFLAWVLGFGAEVKVLSPPCVVQQLKETLNKVLNLY